MVYSRNLFNNRADFNAIIMKQTKDIKQMCITAECGRTRKSVTFPVPAELSDWMNELSQKKAELNESGENTQSFVVDGNRSMVIRISILNFGERF